jgi:hypothetical protein
VSRQICILTRGEAAGYTFFGVLPDCARAHRHCSRKSAEELVNAGLADWCPIGKKMAVTSVRSRRPTVVRGAHGHLGLQWVNLAAYDVRGSKRVIGRSGARSGPVRLFPVPP